MSRVPINLNPNADTWEALRPPADEWVTLDRAYMIRRDDDGWWLLRRTGDVYRKVTNAPRASKMDVQDELMKRRKREGSR